MLKKRYKMRELIDAITLERMIDELEEKKKDTPKTKYAVVVDVKTSLSQDKLQKFIDRIISYAEARGHDMEIVQLVKSSV